MKNNLFLQAIRRLPVEKTPIWLMRQAGRYLPEYQRTRQAAGGFMALCKTPAFAAEVTLQPLRRYDLDAGIIFSDILTIPDAMGLALDVLEGKGPYFANPLKTLSDIERLSLPDSASLSYVYEAISLVQQDLAGNVPLIGFAGSPFTIAAYMLEGESRPHFPRIFNLMAEAPAVLHHLLGLLAQAVSNHLSEQIIVGVNAVMIFDTWGGLLTDVTYPVFSLHYLTQCVTYLKEKHPSIPVILFTKGGNRWLEPMSLTGCDMIGLDWEVSLTEARRRVGDRVALQGNLNPSYLMTNETALRQAAHRVLSEFGSGSGHVFNLGHGICKETPPEHVAILIDAVHHGSQMK
ncbi:MAG: hypothetical protein ACD_45C00261G0001 [uncultured bacterium]|nr:MAG: hypothetical protein ACD_45C00261G0001 [uncultured bacterium]